MNPTGLREGDTMRAFVTGSTGLLGNNLVRTLLGAGHEVLALARSKEKAQRQLGDTAARVVVGDMKDVAGFAGALEGVDVLFHTAAYFREYYTPGDHAASVDRLNVTATMELAQAAQARGVKKMVDTSSSGIIGLKPDGSPGDEETPMWPGSRNNLYFDSKRKVEPLLRAFAQEKGFFIASALPAWMWGPYDAGPTPSGQLVLDALARKLPPAVPPGGATAVDARDVAAGMLRIAEAGRSGERYILADGFADLSELLSNLSALTGNRPPKMRIPYAGALAIAAAAETWSRMTGKPSAISLAGIRLMNARLEVTSAKAQRELGVNFRPFAVTLADSVAWIKANLYEQNNSATAALSGSARGTA
jgi:nucleoside-diphosphate-sugar epimerase